MANMIIDTREHNAVPEIYEKIGSRIDAEIKYMEFGDFYFPAQGIGIERKTTGDFLQSIQGRVSADSPHKKRLFEQLAGLCDSFPKPILLIERQFESSYDYTAVSANVMNILYNWAKIKVYMSNSRQETIDFLERTALYSGPSHNYVIPFVVKKKLPDSKVREMMTMCIDGIGPKAAQLIWSSFADLPQLVEANEEIFNVKLSKLPNKTRAKLYSILHSLQEHK